MDVKLGLAIAALVVCALILFMIKSGKKNAGVPVDPDQNVAKSVVTSLEVLPEIGETLSFTTPPASRIMAGAGRFYPGYEVTFHDVAYLIGMAKDQVKYISTNDPKMTTPEGVKIGSSLDEILPLAQGTELTREAGWGYYVSFKSGWNAGFTSGPTLTSLPAKELPKTLKVMWLFKR